MKRPETATDCPGCPTGWVMADLLCPMCTKRVYASDPDLYYTWTRTRSHMCNQPAEKGRVAAEAFWRGVIVGTAKATYKPRSTRRGVYVLTPLAHAILDASNKKGAIA